MPVFDLRDATIKLKDSGGTNSLTIKIGEGSLSYTEKRNVEYRKNRGKLSDVRLGDEEPIDVSIDAVWEFITGDAGDPGGATSVEDALKKVGGATAWVSVDSDGCNPYAIDVEIEYTPICTATKKETILLEDFRYEQIDHDAVGATLSITGKCNKTTATVTRA